MIIYFAERPYEYHHEIPVARITGGVILTKSEWVFSRAEKDGMECTYGGKEELNKIDADVLVLSRHIRNLPDKPFKVQIFHGYAEKNYTYREINFKSQKNIFFWPCFFIDSIPLIKKFGCFGEYSPFNMIGKRMEDRYDLISIPGKYAEEQLKKKNLLRKNNWIKAGVPKFDGVNFKRKKKTILYAPTWGKYSSIPHALYLLDVLKEYGYEIVFKPHPLVIEKGEFAGIMKKMERYDIISPDPYEDVISFMEEARLLITDYSSSGIEFLIFNQPIVLLHFIKRAEGAEKLLESAAEVARKSSEIDNAVSNALENDEKSMEREKLKNLFFYPVDGKAGRRVAEAIIARL